MYQLQPSILSIPKSGPVKITIMEQVLSRPVSIATGVDRPQMLITGAAHSPSQNHQPTNLGGTKLTTTQNTIH